MPGSPASCAAFKAAMEVLGRPWNGVLLRELQEGPARFSELADRVQIGDRMLSVRLKELEASGLVSRHVDPGPPVRVSYAATPLGAGIGPIQRAIEAWGAQLMASRAAHPTDGSGCAAASAHACGLTDFSEPFDPERPSPDPGAAG